MSQLCRNCLRRGGIWLPQSRLRFCIVRQQCGEWRAMTRPKGPCEVWEGREKNWSSCVPPTATWSQPTAYRHPWGRHPTATLAAWDAPSAHPPSRPRSGKRRGRRRIYGPKTQLRDLVRFAWVSHPTRGAMGRLARAPAYLARFSQGFVSKRNLQKILGRKNSPERCGYFDVFQLDKAA